MRPHGGYYPQFWSDQKNMHSWRGALHSLRQHGGRPAQQTCLREMVISRTTLYNTSLNLSHDEKNMHCCGEALHSLLQNGGRPYKHTCLCDMVTCRTTAGCTTITSIQVSKGVASVMNRCDIHDIMRSEYLADSSCIVSSMIVVNHLDVDARPMCPFYLDHKMPAVVTQ